MSQIDETIRVVNEATKMLKDKYGKCEFKKKINKNWIELFERHLMELTYVFSVEEVKKAYSIAVDDIKIFLEVNAKYRKK